MDVNELVKSIVEPFLKEDTNLEYDNAVPAAKNEDNYPLGECGSCGCDSDEGHELNESGMLKNILKTSNIDAIKKLASLVSQSTMQGYMDKKHPNVDASWEGRNKYMADKMGYDLIDYIDGDDQITNPTVNVELSDEDTFMDRSGVVQEEFSQRMMIRRTLQESSEKKNFINKNKSKILSILTESDNVSAGIAGGTRDMAPFSTLDGYKSFSNDRATKSGYQIVKELFADDQVFAVDKIELQVTANTIKIYGETPTDSNVVKLEETFKKIGNLYQEYIKTGENEDYLNPMNKDNKGGEIGKKNGTSTNSTEKRGTPKMDDTSVPRGLKRNDVDGQEPLTNKGYTEIDDLKKSKVDDRVRQVDEFHDLSSSTATDSSNDITMFDGGIGKGSNKESNDGTPTLNLNASKTLPRDKQSGDPDGVKKTSYDTKTDPDNEFGLKSKTKDPY